MSAITATKPSVHDSESARAVSQEESVHIILMVCKAFTGEIIRVSIRADQTVEQAIPEIADQIDYFTPDWEKIGLYNLTRDFEYELEQIINQTRTQSGDLVIMADGAGCHKTS